MSTEAYHKANYTEQDDRHTKYIKLMQWVVRRYTVNGVLLPDVSPYRRIERAAWDRYFA